MRILRHRRAFEPVFRSVGVFYDCPRRQQMITLVRLSLAGILPLLLFVQGCDKNPLSTVDPRGNAPVVTGFHVAPTIVRLDTIAPSGGLYPVRFVASTQVSDPDGMDKIASVQVSVISPDGTPLETAELHDDGVPPDQIAGDGIYAGDVTANVPLSNVGTYQIVFSAVDVGQRQGTSAIQSVSVYHRSTPPWITQVTGPDSVLIPSVGRTLVIFNVTAGDSSGVGDIKQVKMTVTGGSSPAVFQMTDQHNVADPNLVDGELFADTLQVDNTSVARTFTLLFQAIDRAGDTSAIVSHSLVTHR